MSEKIQKMRSMTIAKLREKLYWSLLSIADDVADIGFSKKHDIWRSVFVSIANGIDRIAWLVMTKEMRHRPGTAAPFDDF